MKTLQNTLVVLAIVLLISCGSEKKETGLPTIDLTKSYPQKEIILQDIADVEYVPLETRDDVLLGHCSVVPAGKDKILAYSMRSGDVFIFDTQGKFINKFNHKGKSGQEYIFILGAMVDSKEEEIFVVDGYKNNNIQVYTMQGEYKRTLKIEDVKLSSNFVLFGEDKILCYDNPNAKNVFAKEKKEDKPTRVGILDRATGKTDTIIELPTTNGVNAFCFFQSRGRKAFMIRSPKMFVRASEGIIINEIACDTIFTLNKERKLTPVLARTPKVSPQDEPLKMLGIEAESKEALYLEVILKKYDGKTRKGFDRTTYQLQKANNQIFEYTLKNADIENEHFAKLKGYFLVPADVLKEYLEENKLKGKLKAVAETLNEDDNPVLVKVKLKNN